MKTNSIAKQISAKERLLAKALKAARTLLSTATVLGIEAPKRRYRRRKKGAKAAAKATVPKSKKRARTHLSRASEEE